MALTTTISPCSLQVREPCDVEIIAVSTHELTPGGTVECQFPNTWCLVTGPSFTRNLQTTHPAGEHYVAVQAPGSDARFALEVRDSHLLCRQGASRHGRLIVATLAEGSVSSGAPLRILYANTFAPYVAERETVWVRVKGEAPDEVPVLSVTPGPGEALRLIAPSGAEPGRPFDVLIVSLDRFENASCTRYGDQVLCLTDGTVVARHLNFVGRVRVRVVLPGEGVYRFRLGDAVSNAVRVEKGCRGPYWGDIHIHTKVSHDGQGTDPYDYARDVSGLDFAGVADHCQSHGQAGYDLVRRWAAEAHEPGRFVTILGDEREPRQMGGGGHYNVYFRDEEAFLAHVGRPGDRVFVDPLEEGHEPPLDPATAMYVPHHTGICFGPWRQGAAGSRVDWHAWPDDRGLRPVVEIYSHHGQSESYAPQHALSYEFNRLRNPERRANTSIPGPYYAQDYWMAGHRLGVIASSDEHSGQGGRRHGGIAAVWADELTREGIFDAIRAKRCYATTGERILVLFSVNGIEMGQCGKAKVGEELALRLLVWGTQLLVRVEILRLRFGRDTAFEPIVSDPPRPESLDAAYEIRDEFTGPCVYYARVTQEPLTWPGMAWTSPVWVDSG